MPRKRIFERDHGIERFSSSTKFHIFFHKNNQSQMYFNKIKLKQLKQNIEKIPNEILTANQIKLQKRSWKVFRKLCTGDIHVEKNPCHYLFYMNLYYN